LSEIGNIDSSLNIRPKQGSESQYSESKSALRPEMKQQNQKPTNLHIGEIVRGEILEKMSDKSLKIKIPTGIFNAYVEGDLKQGDSLHFKVMELKPNMILRVYEAPTRKNNGVKILNEDILRALNLPNDNLHLALVNLLSKQLKYINREDVIKIVNLYISLVHSIDIDKKLNLDQSLELLSLANFNKFPLETELLDKLIPLFLHEKEIADLISNLLNFASKSSNPRWRAVFDLFRSKFQNQQLFDLLGLSNGEKSFFSTIVNALNSSTESQLNALAKQLLEIISAAAYWNLLATAYSGNLVTILPQKVDNRLVLAKLFYNKDESKSSVFHFVANTNLWGDVYFKATAIDDKLSYAISADDKDAEEIINDNITELKSRLSSNGIILAGISFADMSDLVSTINSHADHTIKVVV